MKFMSWSFIDIIDILILYFDILSKIFLKMYSLLAWLAQSFWNTWNKTWKIFFGGVFHPLFWKILGKHCFYPEVHLFPLFSLAAMKKIIKFTKLNCSSIKPSRRIYSYTALIWFIITRFIQQIVVINDTKNYP